MGEAAGRTAVVYDARAGELEEPVLVATARPAATGFRSSQRLEEDLRYS